MLFRSNIVRRPYMRGHVETRYKKNVEGRYVYSSGGNVLSGPGSTQGESGMPWRGFNPSTKGRHWAIPKYYEQLMPEEYIKLSVIDKLEALFNAGHITIEEGNAWPTMVRFLEERDGMPVPDIWAYQPYTEGTVYGTNEGIDNDVSWLGSMGRERLGYPTQKPLGLLERIIKASSSENDTVLDPFCGCGTAVLASQKLSRNWIGIDITHLAISLIEKRMKDAFPEAKFEVIGSPKDLESAQDLAIRDKYQFQWWAVSLVGAHPYQDKKKGSDSGIDGLIYFIDDEDGEYKKIIVSVKGGEHVGSGMVRDLIGTVNNEKAAMGFFVTLTEPTSKMIEAAASADLYTSPLTKESYPKIQILTIKGLMDGTQRPRYPDLGLGLGMFKKAKLERTEKETKLF